jgi:hypothetical protein
MRYQTLDTVRIQQFFFDSTPHFQQEPLKWAGPSTVISTHKKPIGLLHVAMTQGGALFDLIHPQNDNNSFTTLAQSWKTFIHVGQFYSLAVDRIVSQLSSLINPDYSTVSVVNQIQIANQPISYSPRYRTSCQLQAHGSCNQCLK